MSRHRSRNRQGKPSAPHSPAASLASPAGASPFPRLRAATWALIIAVALTLVKLWLTRSQRQFTIGGAGLDDQLFINLAEHLLHGRWLGPYDEATLAKGPFYSMWIASLQWLQIPLRVGDQLAYAASAALAVRALFPILQGAWIRLAAYLLLLLNPISWDMTVLGRVLRQNIYTPLSLALIACAIALCLRPAAPLRRQLPWALGGGLLFAAFWLTREEGIWLAPALLLLTGWFAWQCWHQARLVGLRRAATVLGLGCACAVAPILLVCALNLRHYGWFGTVEMRSSAFTRAYGALTRPLGEREIRLVHVTREMREKLYPHSPAFAELRPTLEGAVGRGWAANSTPWTLVPESECEVAGGWFMWLLRDATRRAGHAHSAGEAMAFYDRLADEVNAACDSGRVPARPPRSGFVPPWKPGTTRDWRKATVEASGFFLRFEGFSALTPTSLGLPEQVVQFRAITGERESPMRGAAPPPSTALTRNDDARVGFLETLGQGLRTPLRLLSVAALLLFPAHVVLLALRRRPATGVLIAAALLGSCAACVLINALIHATSFPTIGVGAFAQAYPLLLLFAIVVLADTAFLASRLFRAHRV